ncbi:MAG TPA: metalloregulator ArsR/SmtB family transcription factor [Kiritimatiellia bacterium]|nr:metalloregulator ArsR/SmtB family transcription factor [Kiritimatiellia bacterium]HMO98372.1 metalloregulator ArsR/SmtB family transcription factor [Kiritimatiellia bacterium]
MKRPPKTHDRARTVRMARMFQLLGDPTRLSLVLGCLEKPRAVSDLAERAGLSLPLASHHLRLLRTAGLVEADRNGRQVFYRPADEHIRHMLTDITDHADHCLYPTTRRRTP